jgi:hypothetical protein
MLHYVALILPPLVRTIRARWSQPYNPMNTTMPSYNQSMLVPTLQSHEHNNAGNSNDQSLDIFC